MKLHYKFPTLKWFGIIFIICLFILFICSLLLLIFNVFQYFDIDYFIDLPRHIQIVLFVFCSDCIFITFMSIWLLTKTICETYFNN